MEIRRIEPRDYSRVREIMFDAAGTRAACDGYPPDPHRYSTVCADAAIAGEHYAVFIGGVMACIFWFLPINARIMSCHTNVASEFQGRGLLKSMMELRDGIADEKGWIIQTYTPAYNVAVWSVLERRGYTLVQVLPDAHGVDGALSDVKVYSRLPKGAADANTHSQVCHA